MIKKLFSFILLNMVALTSFSQTKLLKLDENLLWKLERLSQLQVSPDGKLVMYSLRSYEIKANKGRNEIYLLDLNDEEKSRQPKLILDKEVNAISAKFRPDGKAITFLAEVGESTQLFETGLDGTEMKQLSYLKHGLNGYRISPDQKHIAYYTSVKVEKSIADIYPDLAKSSGRIYDGLNYRHWDTWKNGTYSHVFISSFSSGKLEDPGKDLMSGESFDVPNPPNDGEESISWAPDGNALAYSCKKLSGTAYMLSTNTNIYEYSLETAKTINLTEGMNGYDLAPLYSLDGKYIAWLSMKTSGYEADRNRVMILERKSGKINEATRETDQTADGFSWNRDGSALFLTLIENGSKPLYQFDLASSKLHLLEAGIQDFSNPIQAIKGKDKVILTLRTTLSSPTEIWMINQSKRESSSLVNPNKDILSNLILGKVEKRWIPSSDGKKILTWIIYPPDFDTKKKYPTLLYCQGGPQSPVSQEFSYRWNYQVMASHGYIVVAPNRRGLPGFGTAWNDQIRKDYGGQAMRDLLSAIDQVAKESFIDKDHLGCVGPSFGGFSVYWLAGNHHKRFKAFIAHDGMFNMTSWFGSTEEQWFANYDNGAYWENKKNYLINSPNNFVQNWDTPILIISNEKDFRVPLEQGLEAFTAAQLKGIPSRLLTFPDENHWVLKPQNSILWNRIFFEWLDKYLK